MARDEVAQLLAAINTFERVSGNLQSMGFSSINANLFYRFLGHVRLWFIVGGGDSSSHELNIAELVTYALQSLRHMLAKPSLPSPDHRFLLT
jgi:hypothetical protein